MARTEAPAVKMIASEMPTMPPQLTSFESRCSCEVHAGRAGGREEAHDVADDGEEAALESADPSPGP